MTLPADRWERETYFLKGDSMNKEQIAAAKAVERALNKAGRTGLAGGVYDGAFCLWPSDKETCEYIVDGGSKFFDRVEEKGIMLFTLSIGLDGGAGV